MSSPPKDPPANSISMEVRISAYELRGDIDIQSKADGYSPWSRRPAS